MYISKRMNLGICNDVDGTTECYAKRNKSVSAIWFHSFGIQGKKQIDIVEGKKREREANHEKLLTIESILRFTGAGEATWLMGIKSTCYDEHLVLHVSDESLNSTLENNFTIY